MSHFLHSLFVHNISGVEKRVYQKFGDENEIQILNFDLNNVEG